MKKSSSKGKRSKRLESAEGTVQAISKKYVQARGKKTPVYSFLLDVGDGDQEWFRTGFTEPEFEQDDTISFKYEETKYGFEVDMSTVEVLESADSSDDEDDEDEEDEEPTKKSKFSKSKNSRKASNGTKRSSSATLSKDDYWKRKEERDSEYALQVRFVGARSSAIEHVHNLVAAGAVDLGKTQKKKISVFDELVQKYTVQFFQEVMNLDTLRAFLAPSEEVVESQQFADVGDEDEESEEEEGDED